MLEWFLELNPVHQTLLATCFTWFLTAAGASVVFAFKSINRKLLDGMLGFAAGVMIAASYWSLLAPAIEIAEELNPPASRRSWFLAGRHIPLDYGQNFATSSYRLSHK